MTLRKSAFERERKGIDEFLFEVNSSQHRQQQNQDKEALQNLITNLSSQYKKQLDYRDPALQEIIDQLATGDAQDDSFIEIDNSDLDFAKQQYDEQKVGSSTGGASNLNSQQALAKKVFNLNTNSD